jgi:hypothetical protein
MLLLRYRSGFQGHAIRQRSRYVVVLQHSHVLEHCRTPAVPRRRPFPHTPRVPDTPVLIAADSVPAGTPTWSTEDAVAWTRARRGAWARPLWSVWALLITVVWANVVTPDRPCGDDSPCGADWLGMAEMGLAVGLLYWLPRLPELTLMAAPALAALVAWLELPGAGPMALAANLSVLLALAFGWAAAAERLAARRRQRAAAAAERTAGIRCPLPGSVSPLRRGTIPITAGLLLIGVAGFAVVQALDGISADQRRADGATRTSARVLSRGEESVRVRTDGARHLTLGVSYPEDYRVGETVTVLEDGTWRRLATEPYDAFGWQLLILAGGLPGSSMLLTGLLARSRAAALRRAPVPALRVWERSDDHGRIWVYAGDDDTGRTPLFSGRFTARPPDVDQDETASDDDADVDEDELFTIDTRLHEAVMFGVPYEGGELALATTDRAFRPVVIHTVGSIRLPRPGKGPVLSAEETDTAPKAPSTTDGVPLALAPTGQPRRWGPSPIARTGGVVWALCLLAACTFVVQLLVTEGFGWKVLLLAGTPALAGSAANQLNWRVTADRSGLWLTGPWRVRHVTWERLRAARYTAGGDVRITLRDGSIWELTGLGWPKAERRLGLCPSYVRMVEEVTALHAHPELRPTELVSPRDRGLPMGPVLIVFAILAVASWLVG